MLLADDHAVVRWKRTATTHSLGAGFGIWRMGRHHSMGSMTYAMPSTFFSCNYLTRYLGRCLAPNAS